MEERVSYRGHVENGVVRLEGAIELPEGAAVEVRPVRPATRGRRRAGRPDSAMNLGAQSSIRKRRPQSSAKKPGSPSLGEALAKFAGKAKGLPADASRNLDHYLYGHRKR